MENKKIYLNFTKHRGGCNPHTKGNGPRSSYWRHDRLIIADERQVDYDGEFSSCVKTTIDEVLSDILCNNALPTDTYNEAIECLSQLHKAEVVYIASQDLDKAMEEIFDGEGDE